MKIEMHWPRIMYIFPPQCWSNHGEQNTSLVPISMCIRKIMHPVLILSLEKKKKEYSIPQSYAEFRNCFS